jgi:hypothetical protein
VIKSECLKQAMLRLLERYNIVLKKSHQQWWCKHWETGGGFRHCDARGEIQ